MNQHTQVVLDLLDEHGSRLHALLLKITLDREAAEDLLQELFLRLNRRGAFAKVGDPLGYAVRSATRLAFDWRRSQRRRRDREAEAIEPTGNEHCELTRLEQREDLQAVLDNMQQLSGASREAVVMHYLEEQTYASIAQHLGKTPHQVRALCRKGILRLRKLSDSLAYSTTNIGRNKS